MGLLTPDLTPRRRQHPPAPCHPQMRHRDPAPQSAVLQVGAYSASPRLLDQGAVHHAARPCFMARLRPFARKVARIDPPRVLPGLGRGQPHRLVPGNYADRHVGAVAAVELGNQSLGCFDGDLHAVALSGRIEVAPRLSILPFMDPVTRRVARNMTRMVDVVRWRYGAVSVESTSTTRSACHAPPDHHPR